MSLELEDDATRVFSQVIASAHVNVVFDAKIPAPAAYDARSNTVFIGELIEEQAHLRHGLAIHEVGHKMFSGLDPLFKEKADDELLKRFVKVKRIFNIVDDGFQERCMVARFPGTKKHLQTIFDAFIDTENKPEQDELPVVIQILNVLNFNAKGRKYGKHRDYPAEIKPELLRLAKQAEICHDATLVGRLELCEEIKRLLAEQAEEEKQQEQPQQGGQQDASSSNEQSEAEPDGDEDPDQPTSTNESTEQTDEPGEDTDSEDADGSADEDEEESEDIVDKQCETFSNSLNDHHDKFKVADVANTISLLTYKDFLQVAHVVDITHEVDHDGEKASLRGTSFSNVGRIQKNYGEHLAKTRAAANIIFSKFTAKMQARNYINTRYLKSGRLDVKRLPLYRLNEDIFQNVNVQPNCSNHAFLIMLDWSSSMQSNIMRLVDRVLELTQFAKMADIELEVWLYTTELGNAGTKERCNVFLEKNKYKNFTFNSARFIRVLNTKSHRNMQLNERMFALFSLASMQANGAALLRRNWKHSFSRAQQQLLNIFSMGSTCIQEALLFAQGRIEEIEANNKTVFVLTDGADDKDYNVVMRDGKLVIRNKRTQYGLDIPRSVPLLYKGKSLNGLVPDEDNSGVYRRLHVNKFLAQSGSTEMIGIGWDYTGARLTFGENKTIIIKSTDQSQSISTQLTGVADDRRVGGRDFVKIDNKILDSIVTHLLGDNA